METRLAQLPVGVVIRGGGFEDLTVDVLRSALDELSTELGSSREVGKSPFDIVATIRIALRTTITEVADSLLEQMGHEDAVIALMLDVYAPDEPERDRRNFRLQIQGTEEASVQRPGRILPFFAIHPERPNHLKLLKEAVTRRGFVGVKLYPSLGYEIDGPEMRRVYEYCKRMDLPVLLHCGHGGFYRREEFIDYCNPEHWIDVLSGDLAELRVCFAHFGGWESLGRPGGLDPGTWGATILDLMSDRANVYTDLAYHTGMMANRADEQRYFTRLAELLEDDHLQRRILFGTDSWLLRLDMTDTVYWRYFRAHMSGEDFEKIAALAPKLFVGFPETEDGEMQPNLRRYVDYFDARRSRGGVEPATWLEEAAGGDFTATRDPADWDVTRHAVAASYQHFRSVMTSTQRSKGYKFNRTLPLNHLPYFRPRDPTFEDACQDMARTLLAFCRRIASFSEEHDENSAMDRLVPIFRKGEKRLVDVAGLLERIFDFEQVMA